MSKDSLPFALFGSISITLAIAAAVLMHAQVRNFGQQPQEPQLSTSDYTLSGPYTHKNLSIFLIHGASAQYVKDFLTLQEALEQKKVIVYETKDVNQLAIQNLSDQDVYVQAGDIVKGGQQDRMLGVDLIVPPQSGRLPIAAFCVEHGRWSGRGNERSEVFSSAADAVATKDIKLAAKQANSQGAVWESVTVTQDKLSQNVGTRVNSPVSESSLQLAVENRQVQESADGYVKALSGILKAKDNVIGYVFAINGEINSADVYASSDLFKKLWPKLLKANAIEALAELQGNGKIEPPSVENVRSFLAETQNGKPDEKEVTARVKLVTREVGKSIFFETRDRKQKDSWIHRNYIRK